MKEKIKTFFCVLFLLGALPYIITIVFQGKSEDGKDVPFPAMENQEGSQDAGSLGNQGGNSTDSEKAAAENAKNWDMEKYLVGVVAREMPLTYETEALKAQAVIARTNVLAALQYKEELPESLSSDGLMRLWEDENTRRDYQRLMEAVKATKGISLTSQGKYIYAAFHAVSAGKTRSATEALGKENMPWLAGTDSPSDVSSPEYLKVIFMEKEELVQKLTVAFSDAAIDGQNPLSSIVTEARDSGEYVTQMKIGEKAVSGEEFRNALGLNSACFSLKEVEGKVRIVTKGLGHGLGLSQYGANELAREGASYQDILSTYFKNIEIGF